MDQGELNEHRPSQRASSVARSSRRGSEPASDLTVKVGGDKGSQVGGEENNKHGRIRDNPGPARSGHTR